MMFKRFYARRNSTRKLLVRTYCWGLIPIALLAAFVGDGDLLGRSRCAVRSVTPGMRASSATTAGLQTGSSCCAAKDGPEAIREVKATSQPLLIYSDVKIAQAAGSPHEKEGSRVCVYGMNFGQERGASTLAVGGVPPTAYEKWSDPGAPYGPGRYAEICGRVSHLTPTGSVALQLTTPLGSSNTLPFTVSEGSNRMEPVRLAGIATLSHGN